MKAALARPSLTAMNGTLTEGEEVATELLAERKQVTVLFCDVADSLSLAGSLDPEVWRSILTDFLEIFREEIERLDGTVDKFTGDGAMAIFGAPVAQEDHAVRACRVALRLRDRLDCFGVRLKAEHGITFAVRTGINSGEVVVGAVEASGANYTAIGPRTGRVPAAGRCRRRSSRGPRSWPHSDGRSTIREPRVAWSRSKATSAWARPGFAPSSPRSAGGAACG